MFFQKRNWVPRNCSNSFVFGVESSYFEMLQVWSWNARIWDVSLYIFVYGGPHHPFDGENIRPVWIHNHQSIENFPLKTICADSETETIELCEIIMQVGIPDSCVSAPYLHHLKIWTLNSKNKRVRAISRQSCQGWFFFRFFWLSWDHLRSDSDVCSLTTHAEHTIEW